MFKKRKEEELDTLELIESLDELEEQKNTEQQDDLDELEIINLDEDANEASEEKEQTPEEKKASSRKEFFGTVLYLAFLICVMLLFLKYVGQRTCVNGDSMNNTLQSGDSLMVDKLSYRFKDPERFDIVVFKYEHQKNTYYIKRIIGLPGETVQIKDGMIYIDGEMITEPYGKEVMQYPGLAVEPVTLEEDEYFVLGDNRNNSSDSRDPSVGNVSKDQIVGKAFIRIWPLDEFGILKHQ